MSYRIVYRVLFLNIPDEIDRPGTFNFDFVHQWVFVFVMNSVQKVCFYAYRRAKKLPLLATQSPDASTILLDYSSFNVYDGIRFDPVS
jgi:hypothetical protein